MKHRISKTGTAKLLREKILDKSQRDSNLTFMLRKKKEEYFSSKRLHTGPVKKSRKRPTFYSPRMTKQKMKIPVVKQRKSGGTEFSKLAEFLDVKRSISSANKKKHRKNASLSNVKVKKSVRAKNRRGKPGFKENLERFDLLVKSKNVFWEKAGSPSRLIPSQAESPKRNKRKVNRSISKKKAIGFKSPKNIRHYKEMISNGKSISEIKKRMGDGLEYLVSQRGTVEAYKISFDDRPDKSKKASQKCLAGIERASAAINLRSSVKSKVKKNTLGLNHRSIEFSPISHWRRSKVISSPSRNFKIKFQNQNGKSFLGINSIKLKNGKKKQRKVKKKSDVIMIRKIEEQDEEFSVEKDYLNLANKQPLEEKEVGKARREVSNEKHLSSKKEVDEELKTKIISIKEKINAVKKTRYQRRSLDSLNILKVQELSEGQKSCLVTITNYGAKLKENQEQDEDKDAQKIGAKEAKSEEELSRLSSSSGVNTTKDIHLRNISKETTPLIYNQNRSKDDTSNDIPSPSRELIFNTKSNTKSDSSNPFPL